MDIDEKQFPMAVMAATTQVEPMTLRTWRNRNGLFASMSGDRKWKRFSVLDICIVRSIMIMTQNGVSASDAIWFAETHLSWNIGAILSGEQVGSLIAFHFGGPRDLKTTAMIGADGTVSILNDADTSNNRVAFLMLRDDETVSSIMKRTSGFLHVVDLQCIIDHVLAELAGKD